MYTLINELNGYPKSTQNQTETESKSHKYLLDIRMIYPIGTYDIHQYLSNTQMPRTSLFFECEYAS